MSGELEQLFDQAREYATDYLSTINDRAVMPSNAAIEGLKQFEEPMPDQGTAAPDVLSKLHTFGSPAAVATQGGRFFGFVQGSALPVSVAANWLASAWDQNAGTWVLSPVAAELENVAASWLLDIFDLPRDATVGFVTGATMGEFSAFAAARSALLKRAGYDVKKHGLRNAPSIRIVASAEIHPTNIGALGYLGFGTEEIEYCPVDNQGRIIPERMPELDSTTLVILQAGNINSGAFDPYDQICDMARQAGAWVHVDGAFGLWARTSPKLRHLTQGIEKADSWSTDGHKWLNIPQDSAVYICRDAEAVNDVFGVDAPYLVRDDRRQPNCLTPELSRRARGVEFWAALKFLGKSGIAAQIERCCGHAARFARELAHIGYEVLNETVLNQVAFAYGNESETKAVLARLQSSGTLWLGPTVWKGRFAMRISVSSWATSDADVSRCLDVMEDVLKQQKAA